MEKSDSKVEEDEPGLPKKKIFHGARLTQKEKAELRKAEQS